MKLLKKTVRRIFNGLGYEIVPMRDVPHHSWMGVGRGWDVLLDVGANRGDFYASFKETLGVEAAHLFEPLPSEFAVLQQRFAGNQAVHLHNMALGSENGSASFHVGVEHAPSSSLLASTEVNDALFPQTKAKTQITVPIRRLDDVVPAHELDSKRTFIKLDVQGYEQVVLAGGQEVLKKCDAALVEVQLENLYVGQADFLGLVQTMRSAGLEYQGNYSQVYGDTGRCLYIDALFLRRAK